MLSNPTGSVGLKKKTKEKIYIIMFPVGIVIFSQILHSPHSGLSGIAHGGQPGDLHLRESSSFDIFALGFSGGTPSPPTPLGILREIPRGSLARSPHTDSSGESLGGRGGRGWNLTLWWYTLSLVVMSMQRRRWRGECSLHQAPRFPPPPPPKDTTSSIAGHGSLQQQNGVCFEKQKQNQAK